MADGSVDWNAVISGVMTGVPLGGLALKLAFDMIKEKASHITTLREELAAEKERNIESLKRDRDSLVAAIQALADLEHSREREGRAPPGGANPRRPPDERDPRPR